ncbi:MAG TPA: DNA replication/repair protein RecF [Phototrophicaceae bacterium]|nr:DNA replication/repair protein RecF [Phototrophicaceae bacterium]
MYIEHLSLSNFRNYARLELSLPTDAPVVLHGANAQGKTSLLEAIYYLATAKSPYTASDRQLIHWRAEDDPIPFGRVSAEVGSNKRTLARLEITLMIERTPEGGSRFRKVIKVNGVEKRVRDIVGLVNVVLFLPQDLTLIEGSPADRRRFVDDTLGQVDADYLEAVDQYEKVLPQRNALLRRIAERRGSPRELEFWDEKLVKAGSVIIAGRQRFLRELQALAQQAQYELTGNREMLTLRYQPSFLPTFAGDGQLSFDLIGLDLQRSLTPDQIEPQFAEQLKAEQHESIQRGATLCGPHRDELRLFINERDIGLYGSRGQARTAVMAFKLAELEWMRERIGEWPILLLDEVVAELDAQRRAFLLNRINGATQTLMTTTELDIFTPAFLQRATIWQVKEGQIESANQSR